MRNPFSYPAPTMTSTPALRPNPLVYGTSAAIEHPKQASGTFP